MVNPACVAAKTLPVRMYAGIGLMPMAVGGSGYLQPYYPYGGMCWAFCGGAACGLLACMPQNQTIMAVDLQPIVPSSWGRQ